MPISHALQITLGNPRITPELLPNAFSSLSSNSAAPRNDGNSSKRQKRERRTKVQPAGNVETILRNQKYLIGDKWVAKTPHAFGRNDETCQKNPDPDDSRTQKNGGSVGEKRKRRRPKAPEWNSKGKGAKFPAANKDRSVIDFPSPQSLDGKIYVLDGTNIRHIGGGLGICPTGIKAPAFSVSGPFQKAVISTLLSVCNINLLTSEKIRSVDLRADLLKVLKGIA